MNLQQLKINHSREVFKEYFPDWKEGKNVKCPFHDDKNPSMSIFKGETGEYIFKCFACGKQGDVITCIELKDGISDKEATKIFRNRFNGNTSQMKIEKTYDYTDEKGKLVYQVVRYFPKDFKQRRPNGKGGWIWNMQGIKRVLYRLPEVMKSETVFICEGEKDADKLASMGLASTTNVGGAGKWIPEYNKYLKGKSIVILPDNDNPGKDHSHRVASQLKGIAKALKVVELPNIPEKGDVSNWLESGGSKEKLLAIVQETNEYEPTTGTDVKASTVISQEELLQRAKEILKESTKPCETFDTACLPNTLRKYINDICNRTEAETIMVTSSVLSCVSAFMKKKAYITEDEYFQKLYPNLWMLSIINSGQFKTTALNKGHAICFDNDKALSNIPPTNLTLDDIMKFTILPSRVTPEGLIEHLARGYGGSIIQSEFGGWLATLEKNFNSDLKAILTDFYDVPVFYTYKTRTQGTLKVERPFITICGVSTPEWIDKHYKPEDLSSGFFARFLLFYPPTKDKTPPALPKTKKRADIDSANNFKDILNNLPDNRAYSISDIKSEFESIHNAIYSEFKDMPIEIQKKLEPFLKRWSPTLLKLSMLIQPFLDNSTNILCRDALFSSVDILKQAIKSTVWIFQNLLGESEHLKKRRKVLEYIAQREGKVTWTQLLKSKILEGGTKDYQYVIETLDDTRDIEVIGGWKDKKNMTIALAKI